MEGLEELAGHHVVAAALVDVECGAGASLGTRDGRGWCPCRGWCRRRTTTPLLRVSVSVVFAALVNVVDWFVKPALSRRPYDDEQR